jgi:hypothetical protein
MAGRWKGTKEAPGIGKVLMRKEQTQLPSDPAIPKHTSTQRLVQK